MPNQIEDLNDSQIIRQVLEGKVAVFEILLKRYQALVFKIVGGHVPREMVPEVAGEIFVRAYMALPGYEARKPFGSWLTGIAVRCCSDYWRKQYRSRETAVSALSDEHVSWFNRALSDRSAEEFNRDQSRQEARELLDWALDGLSADDRMVINLVYLEGLSVKEAAHLLGWKAIKVKVRAFRAKAKLRRRLEGLFKGKGG